MIDLEKLIYDLRRLFELSGEPTPEQFAPLAERYDRECDAVNNVLRECGQLLRHGLRSEALQRVRDHAGLLERVTTLDFPERQRLAELCMQHDISPPAKLLTEIVEKLRAADDTERELSALLRNHRLLALARSPLSKRIATLRLICAADATNAVWTRDLATYENARHTQIQDESERAFRTNDLSTLAALIKEVQDAGWKQKPPASLLALATRCYAQLQANQATTRLRTLAPRLADAFSQDDAAAARELKTEWEACRKTLNGHGIPADLLQSTAKALHWIEHHEADSQRQEAFQTALQQLDEGLSSDAKPSAVVGLWKQASSFNEPIPEELEARYRQLYDRFRRRRAMRVVSFGTVAAILLAVVGGGAFYLWQSFEYSQQVGVLADKLNRLIERNEVVQARNELDILKAADSPLAHEPILRTIDARIVGLMEREAQRRRDVAQAFAAVEQAAQWDAPLQLANLTAAEQQLNAVRSLTLLPEDEAQATAVAERIEAGRKQLRADAEMQYREQVAKLTARMSALAAQAERDEAPAVDLLAVKQEAGTLKANALASVGDSSTRLDQVLTQVEQMQRNLEAKNDERRALRNITQAIPDVQAYQAALKAYAERYTQSRRAASFREALRQAALFPPLERWSRFAKQWPTIDYRGLKPAEAQSLQDALKPLLDDATAKQLPSVVALAKQTKYLESIVARSAVGSAQLKKLTALLNDPSLTTLQAVQVTATNGSNKRYYVLEAPALLGNNDQWMLKVVTGFNLETKNTVVAASQLTDTTPTKASLPAHTAIIKRLHERFQELNTRGWEATFIGALDDIQSPSNVEPVVRLLLLLRVLETGATGSSHFARCVQPWRDTIMAGDVQLSVNWLNPDIQDATVERRKAQHVLDRLPSVDALRKEIEAEEAALATLSPEHYEWIGLLMKEDGSAAWQCATNRLPPATDRLVVIHLDESARIEVQTIGRIESGKVMLDGSTARGLYEGCPVFATRSGK